MFTYLLNATVSLIGRLMIALVRLFRPSPDQHDDRVPSSFMKLEKRTVLSVNGTFVAGTLNVDITAGGTETASLRAELDSSSNPTGNFFLDENDNGVWDSSSEVRDAFANLRQVVVNGFNSVGPLSSGGTFNWFGDFSTAPLNMAAVDVIDINNVANANFDSSSTINANGSVNIDAVNTILAGSLSLTTGGSLTVADASPTSTLLLTGTSVVTSSNQINFAVGSFDQDAGATVTATNDIDIEVDTTATIDGQVRSTTGSIFVESMGSGVTMGTTGELIANVGSVKMQATAAGADIVADSLTAGRDILVRAGDDITLNGPITSDTGANAALFDGHIEINAGDLLTSSDAVTAVDGSVFVRGTNVDLLEGGDLNSKLGLYVEAGGSISIASDINAQQAVLIRNGAVTVTATGSVIGTNIAVQSSSFSLAGTIDAAAGVAVAAGSVTMTGNALIDGTSVVIFANNNIALGRVVATNTNIFSDSGSITDNNGAALNVQASTLSMTALRGWIGASDLLGTADLNPNAIDIQVGTLSSNARDGMYFQQSTSNLTIGSAPGVGAGASPVFFRVPFIGPATTGFGNFGLSIGGSSDLTSANGPIKIKVDAGTLTVTDGTNANGIGVTSASGDILLWGENGLIVQARVVATNGDITFRSNGAVDITASGSLQAGDTGLILTNSLTYAGTISAANGLAIQTVTDLTINSAVTSTNGSIALISTAGNVIQNISMNSSADFYVGAAQNYTMAVGTTVAATGNAVIDADGNVNLRQVTAANVAINAGGDILDADANDVANVIAATAILNAGGSIGASNAAVIPASANVNALDTRVTTLSSRSGTQTFIREDNLGIDLIIGSVNAISANIASIKEVKFNSSNPAMTLTGQQTNVAAQEGAEASGALRIVAQGILEINDGSDAGKDAIVAGGDILLRSASNIFLNADVRNTAGNIEIDGSLNVRLDNATLTAAAGTAYIHSNNVNLLSTSAIVADQDVYVTAVATVTLNGDVNSTNGQTQIQGTTIQQGSTSVVDGDEVFMFSIDTLTLNGSVTASGNIVLDTGRDLSMTGSAVSSGGNVFANVARDAFLARLEGNQVTVRATNNILDNNAAAANIVATSASLFATSGTIGAPDTPTPTLNNANALDMQVGTVAATANGSIYLEELAAGGSLTIGGVAAASTTITSEIGVVSFNGSNLANLSVSRSFNAAALSDVQSITGAVYILVNNGGLTVTDGADADVTGIQAVGEVRIRTSGDINVNSGVISTTSRMTALSTAGNAVVNGSVTANGATLVEAAQDVTIANQVRSNGGDLTIFAGDDIAINFTAGNALESAGGSLLLFAQNQNNTGNDGIVMASGSSVAGGTGDVVLAAFNNSNIQLARASGNDVGLFAAGSILDANDDVVANTLNIVATGAVLQANNAIGTADTGNLSTNDNRNAIDLQVNNLAVSVTNSVYLREVDGLTTAAVNASTNRVNQVGGSGFAGIAFSGVSSSNGAIKLQSVTSDIVVSSQVRTNGASNILLETLANDGDIVINQNVTSAGGDVSIRAGDDIDLNANVTTSGLGSIHLLAANNKLDAINGVDMSSATTVSALGSGVRIAAQNGGDILLSRVNASSVSLNASNSIIDNNDAVTPNTLNIQASSLQMAATNGLIGNSDPSSTPAIDTQVTTLAARSALGIFVREVDGVTVDSVATTVSNVLFRSTEDPVVDTLEDLNTTNGGPVKLQTVNGNITINAGSIGGSGVFANNSGDILLQAVASDGSIIINGAVTSTLGANSAAVDGHIEINAGGTVTSSAAVTAEDGAVYVRGTSINLLEGGDLNSNLGLFVEAGGSISIASDIDAEQDVLIRNGPVTVTATGSVVGANIGITSSSLSIAGTIDAVNGVAVSAGSVTMTGNALIEGTSVAMLSTGNIALGRVVATNTNIFSRNGNITDNNGAALNVQASTLGMAALQGSIGASDLSSTPDANPNAIDIQVGTLAANSINGMYFQQSTGNLTIGSAPGTSAVASPVFFRVPFNNASTTGFANFGLSIGGSNDLTASGPIKVKVDAGTLTVTNGTDADGIGVTTSSGDVLLWGENGVNVQSRVEATNGDITFRSNGTVDINSNGSLQASDTCLILANSLNNTGMISAASGLTIQTVADLTVGGSVASTNGSIALISTTGSVNQNTNLQAGVDFYANAAVDYNMTASVSIDATGNAIVRAGNNLNLRLIQANNVALTASSIIDADADQSVNVVADDLIINANNAIGGSDPNPNADSNARAIDLDVNTISTRSGNGGTYLRQIALGGNILIGPVGSIATNIVTKEVKFNSSNPTFSLTAQPTTVAAQENAESSGVFKLVTENGSLNVNDGNDPDDLGVDAVGDILLETRNQAATGGDIFINARVRSSTGHVTLYAADDVLVNSTVSTAGGGSLFIQALNNSLDAIGPRVDGVNVDAVLTTVDGDVLITSAQDIRQNGLISSARGDIGLVATRNLFQTAIGDVTTMSGDAMFEATNGQWIMDTDTMISVGGGDFIGQANDDINLGLISMTNSVENRVSLNSIQGSIRDGNVGSGNVLETVTGSNTSLSLRAGQRIGDVGGGGNASDFAIDLSVDTVAAMASSGVYLREIASGGNLVVDSVSDVKVVVDGVRRSRFDSSVTDVSQTRLSATLEDLATSSNGTISIVAENGTLTVRGGSDTTGISAHGTGDVFVSALNQSDTGSDVHVNGGIRIEAGVIRLIAADDIHTTAEIRNNGAGGIYLIAGNNQTDATGGRVDGIGLGQSVMTTSGNISFVSQADIDTDSAGVMISGVELNIYSGGYTHLNHTNVSILTASVGRPGELDSSFEQTNDNANNRGDDFLFGMNPRNATNGDQLPALSAADFQDNANAASSNYRFQDRLAERYSLFIKNNQDLTIRSILANSSDAPHVYVETIESKNLTIDGTVVTVNTQSTNLGGGVEGAIVLVAGGEFELSNQGRLVTIANYVGGVRTQVINQIGADGDRVLVTEYHGGEGAANFARPVSTRIVNPDIFGSGVQDNDPEIDAFQRVVLNYGSAGELGFDVYIAYADGVLQRFHRASDIGVVDDTSFDPNGRVVDSNSYSSAPRGTPVNAFTRTSLMTQEFVIDNTSLPTVVSVRRADDFFLFENASATEIAQIRDLTVETVEILDVVSITAEIKALPLPEDVPLILPPVLSISPNPKEFVNVILPNSGVELNEIIERQTEISIYQVYFEDLDNDGYADDEELPKDAEVLEYVEIDGAEAKEKKFLAPKTKVKLGSVVAGFGSVTNQEIEAIKAGFLNDPNQPAGAYAIVKKDALSNEYVLEVFSVRDGQDDSSGGNDETPLLQRKEQSSDLDKGADESKPIESGNGIQPGNKQPEPDKLSQWRHSSGVELLAAAMLLNRHKQRADRRVLKSIANEVAPSTGINRSARRSRRIAAILEQTPLNR